MKPKIRNGFLNLKTINYIFIGAYHNIQQKPEPKPYVLKFRGAGANLYKSLKPEPFYNCNRSRRSHAKSDRLRNTERNRVRERVRKEETKKLWNFAI